MRLDEHSIRYITKRVQKILSEGIVNWPTGIKSLKGGIGRLFSHMLRYANEEIYSKYCGDKHASIVVDTLDVDDNDTLLKVFDNGEIKTIEGTIGFEYEFEDYDYAELIKKFDDDLYLVDKDGNKEKINLLDYIDVDKIY